MTQEDFDALYEILSDEEILPEIGYHVRKKYRRQGFTKEAGSAVKTRSMMNCIPI